MDNVKILEVKQSIFAWGKVAPQGRMRERRAITVRKRIATVNFALISHLR